MTSQDVACDLEYSPWKWREFVIEQDVPAMPANSNGMIPIRKAGHYGLILFL